ncbi:hypothetical protein P43SY_007461 [Pythium insidiosum]|uniref:HECT-type E3 ubiquitin transferase n=1 Tax=Pythium insidiosum TaxID=114742 RepID=A0AAD5M6J0_PYTIN|nr:hypothetical protein P43SY_007461 [Pythium insidiosum]
MSDEAELGYHMIWIILLCIPIGWTYYNFAFSRRYRQARSNPLLLDEAQSGALTCPSCAFDNFKSSRQCGKCGALCYAEGTLPPVDVDDWEKNTRISLNLEDNPRVVKWFWEIVREMDDEHRRRLLHFSTGSSRVPLVGFKGLTSSDGRLCPFTLKGVQYATDKYMRSHSCFNMIELPIFPDRATAKRTMEATLDRGLYQLWTNDEAEIGYHMIWIILLCIPIGWTYYNFAFSRRYQQALSNPLLLDSDVGEIRLEAAKIAANDGASTCPSCAFDNFKSSRQCGKCGALCYAEGTLPPVDVDDWEKNTRISLNLEDNPRVVKWFWEIVREMDDEHRRRLLHFSMGSSRVPLVGFKGLTSSDGRLCPFTLKGVQYLEEQYMRSHSCFNMIELPTFPSKEIEKKTIYATLDRDLYAFVSK